MAATVLGIDLGTSSVKVVLATAQGHLLAQSSSAYRVSSPQPGWSEADPQQWLTATGGAVRELVRSHVRAGDEPVAIGFSGQMHGLVVADDHGTPTRPAMLWSDSRAVPQLQHYRGLPDVVRTRLGNPLSPGMAGPMLAWLYENEPDVVKRSRWALQPKDWLRAGLTGQFWTEPSDASATLLCDVDGAAWDRAVLGRLGIDLGILPPVLPSSATPAGRLSHAAAALLGLPAGTLVAAGAADTAAAALGSGFTDPETVQLSVGTGAQLVRPVAVLPAALPEAPVTHLYRAATATGWYRMAAVLNGGLTLDWVRRSLGAGWADLYAAADGRPAPDDPYFLPHVHGERTPHLNPNLRGAWTDLAPGHERTHLLRAALEGVAFAVRDAFEHIVTPVDDVDLLRLAGGGTAEPAWRQLLADVLERPLAPVDVAAASGLGAALLGALAAELTDEANLIVDRTTPIQVAARPRTKLQPLYRERRAAFRARVTALAAAPRVTADSIWQASAPLGNERTPNHG